MGGAVGSNSIEARYFQELQSEEALSSFVNSQKHLYSTPVQNLTEKDAEYVIVAVKHFFEHVVIIQYEIHNTLDDQILSEVQIKISKIETQHGLKMKGMIPLHEEDQIKFDEKRFAYVILSLEGATTPYPLVTISQKMTFKVTQIDVESQDDLGSYEEEYGSIYDLTISTKDYIRGLELPKGQFKDSWESIGA